MIEFTDGTTITYQEAADLIRAEPGGLIARNMVNGNGHRCAGGVLIGSTPKEYWPRQPQGLSAIKLWPEMVNANNQFEGTQEERAEFMAKWFEAQV